MARGLSSSRAASVAAACFVGLLVLGPATAADPPPQQQQQPSACKAEGAGGCRAAAEAAAHELDEGLSLLMTSGSAGRARDRAADHTEGITADSSKNGAAGAAGSNGTAKCNEVLYQGLCYRTCTDMGEMEPRMSPSKCGGVGDYSFIQRCNEDGTSITGSGSAPGISGRPYGGCFGDSSASEVSPDAPNMCTMDCKRKAPSTSVSGVKKPFCCTDGETTPIAGVNGDELMCACDLGIDPPRKWMSRPNGVLKMPPTKPCNTVCDHARAWLMADGIAYCCPGNDKPTVQRLFGGGGDYTVQCSCP